ncbi:hypothetical protein [Streptomyces sp. NPDC002054]|uniref:hypothetical protein n=1 Tax=Streptomyces sp. NPDC002054 TaxID=3154663 RepID=UPI00332CA117
MSWQVEEFGASHHGMVGVVLADGSEPGPVYLDPGSGSNFHVTREWYVYDGRSGRPRADSMRGSCACGWRGTEQYPIDWTQLRDGPLYDADVDTSGPYNDWMVHISHVEARSVPLPEGLQDTLDQLERQLDSLAADAPVAALKAVAVLERLIRHVGRNAAFSAEADGLSPHTIGTALGLSEAEARSRLLRYSLNR